MNMGGSVRKRYRSAKLAEARQSIQWQIWNTQTAALITRHQTTPFDRYDITDSLQRMWPAYYIRC